MWRLAAGGSAAEPQHARPGDRRRGGRGTGSRSLRGRHRECGRRHLPPSGLGVETALAGLRRLRRGAADLAARVPRQQPPGRVYSPAAEADDSEAVGFGDVGGQEEAVSQLQAICQAIREPDSYRRWGVRPPHGVLLFGPPGTGKTLLARALAKESGARFIHVRATDVVSKWYGEAERKLQEAFDWARRERPAVLFFDEIDALGRAREDAHEATHRLVSTFLENMDGLEGSEGVVVLAATNRPEAVDDALTRPGRFDRLVAVGLPDRRGRRAVFEVHLARADRRAGRPVFEPLDEAGWERLLEATEGLSGADIAEAVRRALELKVRAGATAGQISQDELLAQAMSVARPW
ncbi:MAG: ATP-binding protein [Chloroflexi bacterium]|nr:MAG: ATP-binding protein [Chloroflexota bacterium]